jgi:hypothetical protein
MTSREELKEALHEVLFETHASIWGRAYSIARTQDRELCVNELLDKLVMPLLSKINIPQEVAMSNGDFKYLHGHYVWQHPRTDAQFVDWENVAGYQNLGGKGRSLDRANGWEKDEDGEPTDEHRRNHF